MIGYLISASRTRPGRVGLVLLTFIVAVAAIGPFVAPDHPNAFVGVPFAGPSSAHLLGCDTLGRDVLSRLLNGGWVLLVMAIAAALIGVAVGSAAGITAAYLRGRTDGIIMRTVDVLLAFPQLVFALLLVALVGPKLWVIVLAVGASHAPQVARVMRGATLDVSERDFVRAVELTGVSSSRVMVSEILPNLVSPLSVELGLRITYSIVVIAGLAFLGFGQAPPAANWGVMINENRLGLVSNPWSVIAPAIMIALVTIGMNMFTDAMARVALGADGAADPIMLVEAVVAEP